MAVAKVKTVASKVMADHSTKAHKVAREMLRGANAGKGIADKLFPKDTRKKKLDLAKGGARQLMQATMRENKRLAKAQHQPGNK